MIAPRIKVKDQSQVSLDLQKMSELNGVDSMSDINGNDAATERMVIQAVVETTYEHTIGPYVDSMLSSLDQQSEKK